MKPLPPEVDEQYRSLCRRFIEAGDEDNLSASAAADAAFAEFFTRVEGKYGRHPELLEMRAMEHRIQVPGIAGARHALKLLEQAVEVAERHGLPTLYARSAAAWMLRSDVGDMAAARKVLMAGEREAAATPQEDWGRQQWQEEVDELKNGGGR